MYIPKKVWIPIVIAIGIVATVLSTMAILQNIETVKREKIIKENIVARKKAKVERKIFVADSLLNIKIEERIAQVADSIARANAKKYYYVSGTRAFEYYGIKDLSLVKLDRKKTGQNLKVYSRKSDVPGEIIFCVNKYIGNIYLKFKTIVYGEVWDCSMLVERGHPRTCVLTREDNEITDEFWPYKGDYTITRLSGNYHNKRKKVIHLTYKNSRVISKDVDIYDNDKLNRSNRFTFEYHDSHNVVGIWKYGTRYDTLSYLEMKMDEMLFYSDLERLVIKRSKYSLELNIIKPKDKLRKAVITIRGSKLENFTIPTNVLPRGASPWMFYFFLDIRGGEATIKILDE